MRVSITISSVLAALIGCSPGPKVVPHSPQQRTQKSIAEALQQEVSLAGWPTDWSKHLGKTLTLEGTAANAKLGALLLGKDNAIWIDGLQSWPKGFYQGGDHGKRLRVTGTVIKRDDMPVFVEKPGEPPQAGMPVKSEAELEKAKWRYVLKDAKWTVLE